MVASANPASSWAWRSIAVARTGESVLSGLVICLDILFGMSGAPIVGRGDLDMVENGIGSPLIGVVVSHSLSLPVVCGYCCCGDQSEVTLVTGSVVSVEVRVV